MSEIKRVSSNLARIGIEDVERFFKEIKDLFQSPESKFQSAIQTFITNMLKAHPDMLAIQGNRIFKYVFRNKLQGEQKFKVNLKFLSIILAYDFNGRSKNRKNSTFQRIFFLASKFISAIFLTNCRGYIGFYFEYLKTKVRFNIK